MASEKDTEDPSTPVPLKLSWVFGHENRIPAYNISTANQRRVCYVSGSVTVLYDWINNQQIILEGHRNDIQCIAISSDRTVLATFDPGDDNALVLWDLETDLSLNLLNEFCMHGISCMQFSPDNAYLMILSENLPAGGQELYIWNFMDYDEKPILIYNIEKGFDSQDYIGIHSIDPNHFLTSNNRSVIFFRIAEGKLLAHSPVVNQEDFQKPIGAFTQSIYIPNVQIVLSATTLGNFLVWGNRKAKGQRVLTTAFVNPEDRIPIRLVQPHAAKMKLLFLSMHKEFLVSGNSLGQVHFYDTDLQIIKSFKEFDRGSISHISFTYDPVIPTESSICLYTVGEPSVSEEKSNKLNIQDFTISTANGYCGYCFAKDNKLVDVLDANEYCVKAIAASSLRPYICLGDYNGCIQLWNFETKKLENTQFLDGSCKNIECLEFDETCTYLACGLSDGYMLLFDVPALTKAPNFACDTLTAKIIMIKFSPDSQYLTFVDDSCTIALFRLYCILPTRSLIGKGTGKERPDWDLIGKQRQHYLPIVDILYGFRTKKQNLTLFTLGQDRNLIGYELGECTKEIMPLSVVLKVEQTALPTSMCWYPCFDMPSLLAISNSEHKVKIYDIETEKCIKLNLLPMFDSPIRKMFIIQEVTETEEKGIKCIIFKTDHNFGILMLPIDGNPNRARAICSHTVNYLCNVVKDYKNMFLFSSGVSDKWVHMWRINYDALCGSNTAYNLVDPFLVLASKGKCHWMKREIMDVSLSLMLQRTEGRFPVSIQLENRILVSDLTFIFAAIGYYPSKYEISLIEEDIKFTMQYQKGVVSPYIDFEDFIRLYVNYRPVRATETSEIIEACKVVFGLKTDDQLIPREQFQKLMRESGEPIKNEEMLTLVSVLLDDSPSKEGIDDLYVHYEVDNSYYSGKEPRSRADEYKWFAKMHEDEEIDWGELDAKFAESAANDEEEEEDDEEERKEEEENLEKLQLMKSKFKAPLGQMESEQAASDSLEQDPESGVQVERTLEKLLPQSISVEHIVFKLLGLPEQEEKKKKKHLKKKKSQVVEDESKMSSAPSDD